MSWGRPFPSAGLSTQPQQRPTMSIVSICFSWRTLLSDLGSETGLTAASLQISINQSRSVCIFFFREPLLLLPFSYFLHFQDFTYIYLLVPAYFPRIIGTFFLFPNIFSLQPFWSFFLHPVPFPAISGDFGDHLEPIGLQPF